MSDTPLTDSKAFYQDCCGDEYLVVSADFARELERQVSMDTECIDRIRNKCYELEAQVEKDKAEIDRLRVALQRVIATKSYWRRVPDDPWGMEERCIFCGAGDDGHHSYTCPTEKHPDKQVCTEEICPNCDTALPIGCGGVFRNEGKACRLNKDDSGTEEEQ